MSKDQDKRSDRVCNGCGEFKQVNEYYPTSPTLCKLCKNSRGKINRQKRKQRGDYAESVYIRKIKYNLSSTEFNYALKIQNNSCKLCFKEFDLVDGRSFIHVDHCHTSNKVRGILCNKCNTGIGLMHEDINAMLSAIDYLNKHNQKEQNE